jgi:FtsP/CotA-like multicopper oxidase with cupredoxin domain
MTSRKVLNLLVLVSMLTSLVMVSGVSPASAQNTQSPQVVGGGSVKAAPISPTDQTKVPHYFGPYPNWANSPFTLPDVSVQINGDGQGAAATATVGGNGAITGVTIINPGSGYTTATVTFVSTNGSLATADAVVTTSGVVAAITVGQGGSGYTNPFVAITGGGATTDATATAYGGVDSVTLTNPGAGYTLPTVVFDMPDDPNGVQATGHATMDANGAITGVFVDTPGSGYSSAPKLVIRDGTAFAPINNRASKAEAARAKAQEAKKAGPLAPSAINATTTATAKATLVIQSVTIDTYGAGYTSAPAVTIGDSAKTGNGATATATFQTSGAVTGIANLVGGSGYITTGGIKKFQDGLPQLCIPGAGQTFANCANNNLGQHIPVGVPDTTTFTTANGHGPDADYYVIALVQHRERMNSSLPITGTLLREYVQLETPANASLSKHVQLTNDLPNGTSVPALLPGGAQAVAVDDPHYLGPVIVANKDKPVRIVFYNLLPTGADGDLFLPVDSSMMGSGMGPMMMADAVDQGTVMDAVRNPACTEDPKGPDCFKDNRATLHLHGGITPWISDGTPHQWITPANETTPWPQGVSVQAVPDMASVPGVPACTAANDGCMTFYYTNQQSARLMFYHDHAWGITRLNVYAGEAAGYVITDATEQKLINDGTIPGAADTIPLIIQDRTFVPSAAQLAQEDPTWDYTRWGSFGDLWYHHVYMPAQNPGDPSGMSAFGRWMYGPWFWPPAKDAVHGPIANPYYSAACKLDDPTTWQYQTDPFCEPQLIPGTPNISVGMEQFNDTPLVNGTAYPTTTVEAKTYRLRILNAANDRFWNLQWYVADPTTGTDSEVALKAAELAAAQTDPNVVPTPDTAISPAGPSWIQIGSEGGFLPAPTVVPNQPITWIIDPTRFDVGNVDKHSLLLAPAERADVIVDFSKYAGKTLILYNDAPAAFPARVASYDYYTGAPDLSPVGAPTILPGYGPNTRTIMQVKVAATPAPAPAFNLTALQNAFKHHVDGSGVFESGQHPIIVGQAAYNSAYGTSFASSSWCNAPGSTSTTCDGMARISEQGGDLFGFNTLSAPTGKLSIPIEPKALHDEMNSASFDEYGRMTANLGLEAVPATPAAQNIILYPFVNPSTELIDATNLPKGDINVTPITMADGTQVWKLTHNGVDTHPIHFHLYDVQVLNRVTWDNIIIPTEPSELGWKDTIRVSPLEDTIVALRPIIPALPFELPNSIRMLNPMMPAGSTAMFSNIDAAGNPTTNNITNQLVNFGWEYVYHCHILSHEEMDMMRPVSVAMPPNKATGLAFTTSTNRLTLTWTDNSINETSFVVQRSDRPGVWVDLPNPIVRPLNVANTHGTASYIDTTYKAGGGYQYRVVALNTIGYGGEFMSLSAKSISDPVVVGTAPTAPTALTALLQAGPQVRLSWTDNATNETVFVIERATNGGAFAQIATAPARNGTGGVIFVDTTVTAGATPTTYTYRVAAANGVGLSAYTPTAQVIVPALPAAPTISAAAVTVGTGNNRSVRLTWTNNAINPPATGFTVQRATVATGPWTNVANLGTQPTGTQLSYTDAGAKPKNTYYYRILANNGLVSNPSNVWGPVAVP